MDAYDSSDATDLARHIADGRFSPREALEEAIRRADRLAGVLNAVPVRVDDVARGWAEAGLPDGPFTGVPTLLKDLGCEAVDIPTNSGSRLFAGLRHRFDSELYLRLKATGLVPFGRTASPELGIGPVTEAGVYGGPTRNPWNTEHTSGGSSGGAGAVVAAGIVPLAHGSDGGGSVRIPASSCGLVGFKPTRARLPDGPGRGEGWAGMAIGGVLTRSLRDTAIALDACRGADLGAPYRAPPMDEGYAAAMARRPGTLRIAVLSTTFTGDPVDRECRAAVERTAAVLSDLDHDVAPFGALVDVMPMMRAWTTIVACGTALAVRAGLEDPSDVETRLDGVTRGAVRLAERISGADYLAAVQTVHAFGRAMARVFQDIDVLVSPTLREPPARVGRFKPDNEDFMDYRTGPDGVFDYSPFCAVFNASGQPAVSLPLRWTTDDLPVGVHLAAAFGDDERLMSLCAQLEAAMPWAPRQLELIRRLGA